MALAAKLKQEGYQFEVVMVGGGELEEEIKAQIQRENLADVVRLTGFLQPQEVRKQMDEADIFLLPAITRKAGALS